MVSSAHDSILRKVYEAKNSEELAKVYDEWAQDYDNHVFRLGYTFPSVAAGYFGRYIPLGAPVLDAGAGTGIIGEILKALEYGPVDGFDLSNGMIKVAEGRKCYNALKQAVLGETLPYDDNQYAASVAIGVFTAGHAPSSGFDELTRVVKAGGHIIFTIREDVYEHAGFKEYQQELENKGWWKLIKKSPTFNTFSAGEENLFGRVFAYEVTR